MKVISFAASLALILAGCSSGPGEASPAAAQAATSVHPVSGLAIIPLSVTHGASRLDFRVELAASSIEQAKGLMFRTAMGADEGMIFPMDPPRPASFWMKNTVMPLDIIYVGADGRIINIAANAVPYDETPLYSGGLVIGVLELVGGRAAQLGIAVGDKVEW